MYAPSTAARRYADREVELLSVGGRTVVKDRAKGRVLEVATDDLPQDLAWEPAHPHFSRTFVRVYTSVLLVSWLGCVALVAPAVRAAEPSQNRVLRWVLVAVFIAVQTVLHECGHLLALRATGRRADKVGFKLNFGVFPAFYVRMNDTHLLLRTDKLVVHTAGLAVNSVLNLVVIAALLAGHVAPMALAVALFTPGLVANSLPLLRSDGHKTLLALLGVNERRRFRDNPPLVQWLHIASWAMAVASTVVSIHLVLT